MSVTAEGAAGFAPASCAGTSPRWQAAGSSASTHQPLRRCIGGLQQCASHALPAAAGPRARRAPVSRNGGFSIPAEVHPEVEAEDAWLVHEAREVVEVDTAL